MYTLYYRPQCPFCVRVLVFAKEHNITLDLRDIAEQENADALMEKGGRLKVPFLVDNDTSLYESDAIIDYLSKQQ